ncbi:MAG: YicC/YloC family endoribonuclease [Thermoanaerobaculales bacterium]|jgi:uncharacterized protein (TIGR00255 family)|nr:YicC/YloC family endoribonuclease [Thermoanaerobaculales bacterium]
MKLASMTGFGRAQGSISERLRASVVVRSVNHKFLDTVVRTNVREELPELEAAVRNAVCSDLERGRVTVQVDFERTAPLPVRVEVNAEAVSSLVEQLAGLPTADPVTSEVALGDLLGVPGLVSVETASVRPLPEEAEGLAALASQAVGEMVAMRREEAVALQRQIRDDLDEVGGFVEWFEPRAAEFRQMVFDRLAERLAELLGPGSQVEPERQVQEAALLADRADVSEELVRLQSHLAGFRDRLESGGSVGRPLDFMCQEILRELNTLGSKCRELGVADRLVNAKAALERVREQVQNLE